MGTTLKVLYFKSSTHFRKHLNIKKAKMLQSPVVQSIVHLICLLMKNLSCWTWIYPAFANSVEPDQLASEEANWSGSALFAIKYVNF